MKECTEEEMAAIIAERDFYKKVLDSIPAIVHVNNLHTRAVEWINESPEALNGYKKEYILNNPAFLTDNLVDDPDIIDESIYQYKQLNGVSSGIYSFRKANGEVATYHALGVVLDTDGNNVPIRNLAIDIDITHELWSYKQLKRQYEEQTRKLNQAIIDDLTSIELTIVKLLCEGKTLKEIAQLQSRSPHTIDKHIRHIFDKTKIHKVQQLTMWAKEVGLV